MKQRRVLSIILALAFTSISTISAPTYALATQKFNISVAPVIIKTEFKRPQKLVQQKATTKQPASRTTLSSRGEDLADKIIRRGTSVLGTPYRYGATGNGAFDCSGFTSFAYAAANIELPHSSALQATLGTAVKKADLQKGDLVIFNNYSNTEIGHVGIYIGNNNFIEASSSKGITITALSSSYYEKRYVGARRILN